VAARAGMSAAGEGVSAAEAGASGTRAGAYEAGAGGAFLWSHVGVEQWCVRSPNFAVYSGRPRRGRGQGALDPVQAAGVLSILLSLGGNIVPNTAGEYKLEGYNYGGIIAPQPAANMITSMPASS
jgi:hypothetical protein